MRAFSRQRDRPSRRRWLSTVKLLPVDYWSQRNPTFDFSILESTIAPPLSLGLSTDKLLPKLKSVEWSNVKPF